LIPFLLVVALALFKVPADSHFMLAGSFHCEILPDVINLKRIFLNIPHLAAFFSLSLIALASLRKHRYLYAAGGVFLVSLLIELEQLFFVTGNCQAHDLVPNITAIAAAAAAWYLIECAAAWYHGRNTPSGRQHLQPP
jgi:hypothetical protein